ncbi:MAG: hypothetical protein KDC95_14495 [Planctomycetes bacterium]|nr:hypothetical protein [Planctomycetota bacterium]
MTSCHSRIARTLALSCSLGLLTTTLSAQSFDFRSYIHKTWSDTSALSAHKFLERAAADGLLKSNSDRHRAKAAWSDVVLGGRRMRFAQRVRATKAMDPIVSPLAAAVPEREYNGSIGFADDGVALTPAGIQFTGAIGATGEIDSFKFKTVVDGTVTITMQGQGSTPLQRGDFALFNERGHLIYFGESTTTTPATLSLDVPAGTYYIVAEGVGTGSYGINVAFAIKTITALPLSGSINPTLSPALSMFKFVLPSDGTYSITINGGANIDSILVLHSSMLSYMFDVDDASTSANYDAGLKARLPGGTYYVMLTTYGNTGPVALTTSFTAGAVPVLSCNASVSGTIPGGQEDFDAYRVVVSPTQDLTLSVMPRGTAQPIGDPYLFVYDRECNEITESDDDYNFVGSICGGTLPTGTYYAASTGYWDYGDYTIASKCQASATTKTYPGTTTGGSLPAIDTHTTFLVEVGTPAGLEFQVNENTLPDAQIGIVDAATGLSWGYNDDSWFGNAGAEVDGRLAKGNFHAIVKEYAGDSGTFDLTINAPMFRAQTTNLLRGLGKNGDFAILILSTNTTSGLAIPPFGGFLELDLTTGFVVGPVAIPGIGELNYGFAFPPNSGVALQSLHFDVTVLGGEFTNVLR